MQWYEDQARFHPNWTVLDKYIDEGITGTQAKKRPSFMQMIEDAKQGGFDLIVAMSERYSLRGKVRSSSRVRSACGR